MEKEFAKLARKIAKVRELFAKGMGDFAKVVSYCAKKCS